MKIQLQIMDKKPFLLVLLSPKLIDENSRLVPNQPPANQMFRFSQSLAREAPWHGLNMPFFFFGWSETDKSYEGMT